MIFGIVQIPKIEIRQHAVMAGGYMKYPINIPINTRMIVPYIGLCVSDICRAIFPGSDCFKKCPKINDKTAVRRKSNPYMNWGKNR